MFRKSAVAMLSLLIGGGLALTVSSPAAAKATTYKNCTALNKVYKHGVGKPGAKDKTKGVPVKNFQKSTSLYNANKKSDRDKDGVACEKR